MVPIPVVTCTRLSTYGAWAPGPVTIYEKGDVDFDGHLHQGDFKRLVRTLTSKQPIPPGWDVIFDMDRDGLLTSKDIPAFRHALHEERRSEDDEHADGHGDGAHPRHRDADHR